MHYYSGILSEIAGDRLFLDGGGHREDHPKEEGMPDDMFGIDKDRLSPYG